MEFSEKSSYLNRENQEFELKRRIEIIEKSFLDSKDKLNLALLALDKKKVAFFGNTEIFETETEKPEKIKKLKDELEKIENIFDELEFLYPDTEVKVKDNVVFYRIPVSKDEESLTEFAELDNKKDHTREGLLFGYPETAVNVNGTDEELVFDELPKEERKNLSQEGVIKFITFNPSKDHWREELEEVRKNQKLIKEKAPRLYEEIMSSDNDFYLNT